MGHKKAMNWLYKFSFLYRRIFQKSGRAQALREGRANEMEAWMKFSELNSTGHTVQGKVNEHELDFRCSQWQRFLKNKQTVILGLERQKNMAGHMQPTWIWYLALHIVPWVPPVMISEHRARGKFWVLLDMPRKQRNKTKENLLLLLLLLLLLHGGSLGVRFAVHPETFFLAGPHYFSHIFL